MAAFGAVLVMTSLAVQQASAHESHPGLEFSIGVQGVPGCNTRASDVTCTLPAGQPFVVEVSLDQLPDDIDSYGGFDIEADYTGVTASNDANNHDWPDCGFPAAVTEADFVAWGCAIGIPPAGPSSYIGPIGTVTFTCTANGTIALAHGDNTTDLVQAVIDQGPSTPVVSIIHTEGVDTKETLTINCGSVPAQTPGIVTGGTPGPAGPTPGQAHPDITGLTPSLGDATPGATLEPTDAANATQTAAVEATATAKALLGEPPGRNDESDSNTWIWIVIIVAAVAAVGIAGGGYWWFRRAQASGGGTGGTPTSGSSTPSGGTPTSGAGSAGATPSSGGGGGSTAS